MTLHHEQEIADIRHQLARADDIIELQDQQLAAFHAGNRRDVFTIDKHEHIEASGWSHDCSHGWDAQGREVEVERLIYMTEGPGMRVAIDWRYPS